MNPSRNFRLIIMAFVAAGSTLLVIACESGNPSTETSELSMERKEFAIALHGGAGVISRDIDSGVRDGYLSSLEEALAIGRDLLSGGGSSIDAVEAVIRYLEDDERFNAGRGAVFTSEGVHELDASIMDGSKLNAGAVAGVRTIKNPITLARHVMEESRHVMFAAEGAELFADQTDVERVENSYFSTERRREQLESAREQSSVILDHSVPGHDPGTAHAASTYNHRTESNRNDKQKKYGTVGVAALDRAGNLAAGTSTGGMTNKQPGRVGDSPVISAGTYADNNSCAVSATGHGEKFIRNAVAYQVCAGMEYGGLSLQESAEKVIREKLDEGDGGIIAVDKYGNITQEFSSPGMFRGAADSRGRFEVAIWD